MNEKGKLPDKLEDFALVKERKIEYENPLEEYDIERFDD
jgi:hypothetical protein